MPKNPNTNIGPLGLEQLGYESQVVVLYKDRCVTGPDFLQYGLGETPIDSGVMPPVFDAEHRPFMSQVAQRP
jgi:hypothetical protein